MHSRIYAVILKIGYIWRNRIIKGGNRMSSSYINKVSYGTCKRCGKVLAYTPIALIAREATTGCISYGQTQTRELQKSLAHNSNICRECIIAVRDVRIKKFLSLPRLIFKKLIRL
jgi:hypothetical protein